MKLMKGLSVDGMKKHPSLIPLYGCVVVGCAIAGWYTIRLAAKNPDVTWTRKQNGEPWQEYTNKRYKLYDPGHDDYENAVKPPTF